MSTTGIEFFGKSSGKPNVIAEVLYERNCATGTTVQISYIGNPESDKIITIQNDSFGLKRIYSSNIYTRDPSSLGIKWAIDRVLHLDSSALHALPSFLTRWSIEQEAVFAALCSQKEQVRSLGKKWLLEEIEFDEGVPVSPESITPVEDFSPQDFSSEFLSPQDHTDSEILANFLSEDSRVREQGVLYLLNARMAAVWKQHTTAEERIRSYFDQLWEFQQAHFSNNEGLEYFAALENRQPLSHEQEENLPHAILIALWSSGHPYHGRCKEILSEIVSRRRQGEMFSTFEERGPLGVMIYNLYCDNAIPLCILDQLELPLRIRTFSAKSSKKQEIEREEKFCFKTLTELQAQIRATAQPSSRNRVWTV